MNREPVSISTLMTPVSTPTAAKAPLHADRAVAIGHREAFDLSSDVRTPRSRRDQVERNRPAGPSLSAPPQAGFELACITDHTRPIPTGPLSRVPPRRCRDEHPFFIACPTVVA